ncbi:eIF2 kinase Gcn2p negative regulator [Pleurotus ostreatus]|uniref:eIF2 kinase Gcn2p negative regulator n=1 Tax=Pleurotus ostreatus TaxID=5322 RepID=A0A8H7DS75_PLEOS|nr:eIF2 kinase Gcn2p negative regulator [Pleurotus ostreatus]KAF7432726.1 eIF2 kinase Gcn2p negative regulator [Pleurotus ostreatus]
MSADERNHAQELEELIEQLSAMPDREQVAAELGALQSIYGEGVLKIWLPDGNNASPRKGSLDESLRFEITLGLLPPHEEITVHILISLPPTYPSTSPPQLQLLSRYIGAFGADSNLFGAILRVYISVNGVEWAADSICVFDGLQRMLELCTEWYDEKLTNYAIGQVIRDAAEETNNSKATTSTAFLNSDTDESHRAPTVTAAPTFGIPEGIQIFEAEPITDRKSAFVGRACRISHPSQVPLILSHLMSDRKISRAAHPIINAWRCHVGNVLHQDNDDDGETAAGGRLAHLLQILDVDNVLIIVTRYFGGIHLGPDRFKHINQAARNALDIGGILDAPDTKKATGSRAKKR